MGRSKEWQKGERNEAVQGSLPKLAARAELLGGPCEVGQSLPATRVARRSILIQHNSITLHKRYDRKQMSITPLFTET